MQVVLIRVSFVFNVSSIWPVLKQKAEGNVFYQTVYTTKMFANISAVERMSFCRRQQIATHARAWYLKMPLLFSIFLRYGKRDEISPIFLVVVAPIARLLALDVDPSISFSLAADG